MLPLLASAGLRIINLECCISARGRPWSATPKAFHFRAPPVATEVLRAGRIDLCSLANNHVLDYGEEGLLDTLRLLDAAGISHAGAGRDLAEARRPALVHLEGKTVGMVAFTDNEPGFAATDERAGTNFLPVSLEPKVLQVVEQCIASAREAGAELVVFSNHWGPNMVQRPSPLFVQFARAAIDRGADLYYGHSAHLFQGVELYRGRWILYDTGDFLDDYAVDPLFRNDWSLLFQVGLGEFGSELQLFPTTLSYAQVNRAGAEERERILEKMSRLSLELGTPLERKGDRLAFWSGEPAAAYDWEIPP